MASGSATRIAVLRPCAIQACAFFAAVAEPLLVSKPVEQHFRKGRIAGL